MATIDQVKRDPRVFNALAEGVGIVWKDKNGDRLQDLAEIQAISGFDQSEQYGKPYPPVDALLRVAAIQVNLELPKAMRMGVELYRQIKSVKDELDSVATVAAYSVRHPQEGESSEEAVARIHYEYLTTLIDANRNGTGRTQTGYKAQLGYLFNKGALRIDADKPLIQEDIIGIQRAVAEMRLKMQEVFEHEDKAAAADFLAEASAIPADWDAKIVPQLAKINGTSGPNRYGRLHVIFGHVPPRTETPPAPTQPHVPTGEIVVAERPSGGCGCSPGGRP